MVVNQTTNQQSGDTLIEVVFSFAIISAIFVFAATGAFNAWRLSRAGGERTQATFYAQQQSEALRAFKEGELWTEFFVQDVKNFIPVNKQGCYYPSNPPSCIGTSPEGEGVLNSANSFHMDVYNTNSGLPPAVCKANNDTKKTPTSWMMCPRSTTKSPPNSSATYTIVIVPNYQAINEPLNTGTFRFDIKVTWTSSLGNRTEESSMVVLLSRSS